MPTLSELMVRISGDPSMFMAASRAVRAEYAALERDVAIASARMSQTMVGAGRSMTFGLTLPITALGVAIGKLSADFSVSMAKISGLTNVGRAQTMAWREDILKLSEAMGQSPKELADAMYFIASSGIGAAKSMEVLRITSMAAAAGLGETKTIASTVTSALNAYAGTGLTAAQATDALVQAVKEGKVAPDQFAGALGNVVSIAAEMHVPFQDLTAAIASMTRVGLTSAESVTAVKRVLTELLHPTKAAREEIASWAKANGDASFTIANLRKEAGENFIGMLLKVKSEVHNNAEAFSKIFNGMKALNGVMALTGAQASSVQQLFDHLRNSAGATNKAFGEMSDTIGFKWKQAMAALQAAGIKAGDALSPLFNQIIDHIKSMAEAFSNLSPETKRQIADWLALAAAIGPILYLLGNIGRVAKIVYDSFVMMKAGQVLLGVAMGATAMEARSLTTVLQYVWISGLGPGILIIGGVTAALYGLYKAYEYVSGEADRYQEQQDREWKQHEKLLDISTERAAKTRDLYKEYEVLSAKTNKTTSEAKQLQDVMNQLSTLAPSLVTGYDSQGNALGFLAGQYAKAAAAARDLAVAQAQAARLDITGKKFTPAVDAREKARQKLEDYKATGPGGKLPGRSFLDEDNVSSYMFTGGGPEAPKESSAFNSKLRDLESQYAESKRHVDDINRQDKELGKGIDDIKKGVQVKTAGAGGGGHTPFGMEADEHPGGGGRGHKARAPKLTQEQKDAKKLAEEYARVQNDLNQKIAQGGISSEKQALAYRLVDGDLKKLTTTQKLHLTHLQAQVDFLKKVADANKLYTDTVAELNKQMFLLNDDSNEQQAVAERLYGKYKDLSAAQFSVILGKAKFIDQDKETKEIQNAENERVQGLIDSYNNLHKSLDDTLRTHADRSMLDTVKSSFKPGGEFERMAGTPNQTNAEDKARKVDSTQLSDKNSDDIASMQQQVAMIGKTTEYQKELWNVTSGYFKDLSQEEKNARLAAAQSIDDKNKEVDAENKLEEAQAKRAARFAELVKQYDRQLIEMKGATKAQQLAFLGMDEGLSDSQAKQISAMKQTIQQIKQIQDTIKQFAENTTKVLDTLVNDIWLHGFKNLFQEILQGFGDMLRQMATQWLNSQINQLLTKNLQGLIGGIGVGGVGIGGGTGSPGGSGNSILDGIGESFIPSLTSNSMSTNLTNSLATGFIQSSPAVTRSVVSSSQSGDNSSPIVINIQGVHDTPTMLANKNALATGIAQELQRRQRRDGVRRGV